MVARYTQRLLVILVLLVSWPAAGEPQLFGGAPVVVLKGSHYERGVAHGKALHRQIVDLVDNYLAQKVSAPALFFVMLASVAPDIDVSEGLKAEARGIVDGAMEAGGGTFRSRYRTSDFTWQEILALNTYIDYIGTACSSVSARGEATKETELAGESVLARNLDWSLSPELLRNQVLFVHLPSEADEQPFASVGFAGFLGCLSCINQGGLGAFLNLGYGSRTGTFPPKGAFVPAALAFRAGIEARGSGEADALTSFATALGTADTVGSFIVHAIVSRKVATDAAAVIELAGDRHAIRRATDDSHPGPEVLIATNHHRKGVEPSGCRRYRHARKEAVRLAGKLTPDALWTILTGMKRDDTMQRMLYVPSTGEFRLSIRQAGEAGKLTKKARFDQPFAPVEAITLDQLFALEPR